MIELELLGTMAFAMAPQRSLFSHICRIREEFGLAQEK